ncbi:MAG: hypothetical protein ACRC9K_12220 [Afipia sp.]
MTALAQDRNTPRAQGDVKSLPMSASLIYAGAIVARNAAGYATKGAVATTLIGVGRADERVDNSAGAAGDKRIKVCTGIFRFANSAAGDLITIAEIGKPAYIVDDQTVAKTSGTNTRSIAGFVYDVDDTGVWIEFDESKVQAFLT